MMRFSGLVLLMTAWLLASGVSHAQSTADERRAEKPAQTTAPGNPPAEKQQRRTSKPADTFKPSERIGADSAVSFPVDI